MRIKVAEERQEIDIPISDVVQDGGKLNILPTVKNYFTIDYKPKNDKLTLVAGGFIGVIPVNDSLAVEIRPKFSISNLTRIVSIAEDKYNTLDFFSRKYREVPNFNFVVLEFMAECLTNELKVLDSEGVLKTYILRNENSDTIRGRININNSIKIHWSHGHFNKASINFYDFTNNNSFNRLIKYSLKYCIEELQYLNTTNKRLINSLIYFYSLFESIPLEPYSDSFGEVFNIIKNDKVSILRTYYINICEICRLIVEKTGILFSELGEDHKLNTFTLDMSFTFEKYILNIIRLNRTIFPENTIIFDGNFEGRKKFFNQPSKGKGDAKPDIIIKQNHTINLIADVKYKFKSKETDRYQIISHALSYNTKNTILILPKSDTYYCDQLVNLGSVGEDYKINVYEYYYDLSNENLVEEENKLINTLLGIFTTDDM